jgi:hypothetical protein
MATISDEMQVRAHELKRGAEEYERLIDELCGARAVSQEREAAAVAEAAADDFIKDFLPQQSKPKKQIGKKKIKKGQKDRGRQV